MGDPWTEQELSFLRRRWPDMSDAEIAEKLGRTPWAVQTKRYQLGIAIDPADWSSEDDAYIREHWKEQTNEELAKTLGRKPHAVYQRGLSLGLLRRRSAPLGSRTWTADELTYLNENWGMVPVKTICKRLNRTKAGVLLPKLANSA